MTGYWVTFEDGQSGYVQGVSPYHAVSIAEHLTKKKVKHGGTKWKPELLGLPYPARPIIWQFDDPVTGKCPPFCYRPNECAGKGCCPRDRSCCD